MPTKTKARGFTLIELAIVLTVISILAAVIVPDFIEVARNDMADKAAKDVIQLHDAAKWFLHNSAPADNPAAAVWPGQGNPAVCVVGNAAARAQLSGTYVSNQAFTNPWGGAYTMSSTGAAGACSFVITTTVPVRVLRMVEAMTPQGTCTPGGVCTSRIPKPGLEASLSSFDPPMTQTLCENGLGGVLDNTTTPPTCQLDTGQRTAATCTWRSGTCLQGEMVSGTRCQGKYCSSVENYCCTTTNL